MKAKQSDQLLNDQGYKGKLGPMALNTLEHRIAMISKAHQNLDLDNPCGHTQVRELLKRVRAGQAKRNVRPHKQAALTKEPLQALLDTCDESPRGKRDRALRLCDTYSPRMAPSYRGARHPDFLITVVFMKSAAPDLELYQSDKRHPSVAGTYLASCAVYATLLRKSPVGATYTAGLSPESAALLQQAAWDAVQEYFRQQVSGGNPLKNRSRES